MPNYFAHLTYGAKVYDRLPPDLQSILRREWEAFCCGQYGPDPLFFYYPGMHTPTELEGHELHRRSPAVVLERFRRPAEEGVPYAFGYAAGYLCHYLLDSACHPYVYANASSDTNSHMAMEGEFDRYLMTQAGHDAGKETPLVLPTDPQICQVASLGYVHATPAQFRRALHWFYKTSRLLTHLIGSPLRVVPDLLQTKKSMGRGIVLASAPNFHAHVSNAHLEQLLLERVDDGTAQVARLLECYRTGAPLEFPWTLTFLGESPDEEWYNFYPRA